MNFDNKRSIELSKPGAQTVGALLPGMMALCHRRPQQHCRSHSACPHSSCILGLLPLCLWLCLRSFSMTVLLSQLSSQAPPLLHIVLGIPKMAQHHFRPSCIEKTREGPLAFADIGQVVIRQQGQGRALLESQLARQAPAARIDGQLVQLQQQEGSLRSCMGERPFHRVVQYACC